MWRATLVCAIVAAGCAGHRDVEDAPAKKQKPPEVVLTPQPFGAIHSRTGDPYSLADTPQVRDGVLRVPVRHAKGCDDRRLLLEPTGTSPTQPTVVTAALVMQAGGGECVTEETEIFEFDLLTQLGPGCYDALFLDTPEGVVNLPLHQLGCEGLPAAAFAPEIPEEQRRWGAPYRVASAPHLENGVVHLSARYSGGCRAHRWTVQLGENRTDRRVRTTTADLQHSADGDRCLQVMTEEVAVDVRPWLGDSCPDVLELHVPEVLPTGDVFDRAFLLAVEPGEDCVVVEEPAVTGANAPEEGAAPVAP
jgi:hypothetical protein